MNRFYPDNAFHMFDRLVEQPYCLFQINTPHPEKIYQRLVRYQDFSSRAIYAWKSGQGLYRTNLPDIFAPNTGNLINALLHATLSNHFGLYLFTDIGKALHSPRAIEIINSLTSKNFSHKKVLIFAEKSPDIPPQITQHFISIGHIISYLENTERDKLAG